MYTVSEIRQRVQGTEQERTGYNAMADAWESMWRLEAFKETRAQANQKGREQVVLPDPQNVVNLAMRLLANEPKIEIPTDMDAVTEDSEANADLRKKYLMYLWQRSNIDQRRNLFSDISWQGLVLGRFCLEIKWVKDQLPAMLKDKRCPILIRTLDPRNVGIKYGPLYTQWAYHKYREEAVTIQNRYPDLDLPHSIEASVYNDRTEWEVIDYWWTADDGSVWNAVIVADQFAKEPMKTKYPLIPIIESGGDTQPTADESTRYLSILHPIKDTWKYKCILASQMATGIMYHYWPLIKYRTRTGKLPEGFKLGPGETVALHEGEDIDAMQIGVNMPLSDSMMNMLQGADQQSTFPGVMYGQAPGSVQAGFGVSLLADAARGRINQLRQNLEFVVQQVNEIALCMVEKFGGKNGISLWGRYESAGELSKITITKAEVGGNYENLVSLMPNVPNDDMQQLTLWLRMIEAGIMSRQTFRQKSASVAFPEDEEKRVLYEQALAQEGNPVAEFLRQLALEQKTSMPHANWFAQQALQQMMGPPPEIVEAMQQQQMEQQAAMQQQMMAQQMMAQQQAMMPPPPMIGGPEDLMDPSMQNPQMVPGMPPQMQGQITEDMIQPGMDPTVYQQLVNGDVPPPVPTMDELRGR